METLTMNNSNLNITETKNYTAVCSSGGLGTSKSKYIGYECTVAAELLVDRARFHQGVHPETKMVYGDFTKKIDEIARLHIEKHNSGILYTLPCQPFSLAGGQHLGDDETWLFLSALKLIKKIINLGGDVDWVMWENAPYFISNKQDTIITDKLGGKTILQHITDELGKEGFHVHAKILDASFYGTAQARKRGIILCRRGQVWNFPAPDDKQLTCFDVIGDRKVYTVLNSEQMRDSDNEFHRIPYVSKVQETFIRLVPSGEAAIKFFEKMGWSRTMVVNPNGTPSQAQHINSAFGRNSWDRPNHTIIQGSDSLCGDWTLHPGNPTGTDAEGRTIYSDPRPYSVAEIFALTGLDDNFIKAIPAWARPNDDLLRQLCGEALLPNLFNRCLKSLAD